MAVHSCPGAGPFGTHVPYGNGCVCWESNNATFNFPVRKGVGSALKIKNCQFSQFSISLTNGSKLEEIRQKQTCPEVIKLFSCSTQLSINFFLLINVKMPTIVGILTFMSGKNIILCLSERQKCRISRYFYTYEHLKFHAQLS